MKYPMMMGYFRTQLLNTIGYHAYRAMQRGKRCLVTTR